MSAKVMVLGTYHFAEHGSHLIELEAKNILSSKKQKELIDVIHSISKYKPTKIAVEVNYENDQRLSELYKSYLNNNQFEKNEIISEGNEVYQLSFPIAKKFGHKKIYAVDKPVTLPAEVIGYAQKNNPDMYNDFIRDANALKEVVSEKLEKESIIDILKFLNDQNRVNCEHSNLYLRMVQVGAGLNYEGVMTLTKWYERNLYIFGNIQKIAKENDRILVIYGSGHIKILQELIDNYQGMDLVRSVEYLS